MIIFEQALKRIFKSKLKIIVLLVVPILFIMLFSTKEESSLSIGIVDKDNSYLSGSLTGSIKNINRVSAKDMNEKSINDKVTSFGIDYALVIEPGFEKNLLLGKKPDIREFYIVDKEKLYYLKAFIENYISNVKIIAKGAGYNKDSFDKMFRNYNDQSLGCANKARLDSNAERTRMSLGFLIWFMLFMSVATSGLILEDKSSGVFYRVFYAPVSLKRYMLENITAFIITALIQVTVVLAAIKLLLGSEPLKLFFNIYFLFLAFSMVCIAFGLWLVSVFKKPIHAYTTAALVATPLAMIGGIWWPVDIMPEIIRKIGLFLPTTWMMSGIDKLLYENKSIFNCSLDLLVLLIFIITFLAAGLIRKVDVSK